MRRVLITRPATQADGLVDLLATRGISATCVPTVAIDARSCADELSAALRRLDGVAWLVVTSPNGADAVIRSAAAGTPIPTSVRVAAVGPVTAEALRAGGIAVHHVPSVYRTASMADGLGDVRGERVVLARGDLATDELRAALEARGAAVEEVVAYRTLVGPPSSRDGLHAALADGLDAITFMSSSSVHGLVALATIEDAARARRLPSFCVGPVTAATAREAGFRVVAVAREHTASGLADALAGHLGAVRS